MQLQPQALRKKSVLMHPVVFVTGFTLLGLLFATQEWTNMRRAGYAIGAAYTLGSWGSQYLMWGIICWVLWRLFQPFIQSASIFQMVTIVLPISLIACLIEEMIWVAFFPGYPMRRAPAAYWARVAWNFRGDLAESMSIFWGAFFFFRAMGYYQQLREKETAAVQLEAQLANAKIAALRMQLNPHFLFNTMNSISSLMRIDIDAADSLLEQLSSLLRMTLERRDVQLIPLHDEIEFTETYLAMQDRRYAGRVTRRLTVDPDLHDALVPAMILQPIVENAYVHGLSKLDRGGELSIEVVKDAEWVKALVTNSGLGLGVETEEQLNGHRVGLANVKNRLRLHYGDSCGFSIREIDRARVEVSISIPLQLSTSSVESLTRYGV
jgi:two-component system LytT family sensor kinase